MDQTAGEIDAHIDRTHERLGSHNGEPEDTVDAVTDWREHFRQRPLLCLGLAFAGGALLTMALSAKTSRRESAEAGTRRFADGSSLHTQALELWNNTKGALLGVVTAHIKNYIIELVPDFDEHYRRAEQRATKTDPATAALGRTSAG